MAKTDHKTAADYMKTLDKADQKAVNAIRKAITDAVPEVDEVISYQILAYKYLGFIFYLAATKHHYAISCPPPFTVYERFAAQLRGFDMSKTTVRFPKDKPLPLKLISDMAKFRAEEKRKKAAEKKPKK